MYTKNRMRNLFIKKSKYNYSDELPMWAQIVIVTLLGIVGYICLIVIMSL